MAIQGTVTSVTKPKKPEVPQVATPPKPALGYGGADYNTAEAAMKKQIAQNQANIAGNDAHRQSEIQRALQVIAQREAQGLDTSAQNKYLTVNLGYTPPAASTPTAQASQATAPGNASQGSELMSLMRQIATRESTPFSYDPNSDPAYQAALKRAGANIEQGNAAAQAEMNRRGILNSTITSDRMSEIAANEMGRVETDVLPNLMQQAYQQYLNQQAQEQQQFANMGNLAQMYFGEDQRGIDNQFATSDRTGSLNGIRTLAGQQLDLQRQGLDLQRQGQEFDQQFTQEQFAYQKARDAISDQRWAQQFDEDVRRFGLQQALNQLQENNQQAYRQAQLALSQDDNARQWAQFDWEMMNPSGSSARGGLTANQVLNSMQSLYTDPVYTTDESGNQTRAGSKITSDPAKRERMFLNVVDAGLSDSETQQILASLGMTKSEIDKHMKKYSGN